MDSLGQIKILDGSMLGEYFKETIKTISTSIGLQLSEIVEFYLVNLLLEFEKVENLYIRTDKRLEEEPLAMMLSKAISGDRATQIRELKKLGDTALYTTSFFKEKIESGPVTPDYYIDMGSSAYGTLSDQLSGQKTFAELYKELSEKFEDLVSVLSGIESSKEASSNSDLLGIYERWLKNHDEKLYKILIKEGMIPDERKNSC